MNTKENKYTKSKEIITNSKFTLKGVKTFLGREGYGVNATLYYEGKKVAFLLDSGNGGELSVDWESKYDRKKEEFIRIPIVEEAKLYRDTLINSLPKTTWGDLSEARGEKSIIDSKDDYTWDTEAIMNTLVDYELDNKEWKKNLRNLCIFKTKEKQIIKFRTKVKDFNNITNTKKYGSIKVIEYFEKEYKDCVILNLLPQNKAFEYFVKYIK